MWQGLLAFPMTWTHSLKAVILSTFYVIGASLFNILLTNFFFEIQLSSDKVLDEYQIGLDVDIFMKEETYIARLGLVGVKG